MKDEQEYGNLGGGRLDVKPRAKLLARKISRIETAAALEALHTNLATATVIFEHHGDAGREGAWRALTDVISFLRGQGVPTQALLPLTSIASALTDLDRRVTSPLFAPRRGPGRPPKSTIHRANDAFLAVVTECCVQCAKQDGATDPLKLGAQEAARLVNSSPVAISVTATQMREVREAISEICADDPRRIMFDALMREASQAASVLAWAASFVKSGWVPEPHVSE